MLLWLYRRTQQYTKSKEIIKRYDSYENSHRFIHGLALTMHSEAYKYIDLKENNSALLSFKSSIKLLKKAFEHYENVEFENISLKKLLSKQKIGIINTLIDANLRIIEITKDINRDRLKESRNQLNVLKKKIETELPEINYLTLETINHTESELEYYEALCFFNDKEYLDSVVKLNYTVDRLKIITKSKTLIDSRFKKIESLINELRYKNLVALEIL